ncbi:hypothetical protein U9M48_020805 [Paspalum notatum var. saurae]|uniref:Uncharacterized protein n=1 Tax=Paspalum notatum var. saurae TaxID=547442 RepID=A0AAQ3WSE4_PASNO
MLAFTVSLFLTPWLILLGCRYLPTGSRGGNPLVLIHKAPVTFNKKTRVLKDFFFEKHIEEPSQGSEESE